VIEQVDTAIERFLRDVVGLRAEQVDVAFHAPEPERIASLTRPTIVCFLWRIARDATSARSGVETRDEDGQAQHRAPTPFIALRYLLTAWTREVRDEHALLGSVLTAVLAHRRLPESVMPASLRGLRCPLSVAEDSQPLPPSLWEPGKPRPGLDLLVGVPADVGLWVDRAVPAESVVLSVLDRHRAGGDGPRPRRRTESPAAAPGDRRRREQGGDPAGAADVGPAVGGTDEGQATSTQDADPPLRRRRAGGALVMEGRLRRTEPTAPPA
jgi:hypothetical protein